MRRLMLTSAACSAIALGFALTEANAAPTLSGRIAATGANTDLQNIWWRRICDRDGDRCRRVWVREDEDDRRIIVPFGFRIWDGDDRRRRYRDDRRY